MKHYLLVLWVIAACSFPAKAKEETKKIYIRNSSELIQAIKSLSLRTILLLEPGIFSGDIYLSDIKGKVEQHVVIEGIGPDNPPV